VDDNPFAPFLRAPSRRLQGIQQRNEQ
jgi:hypothetical protein